MRIVLIGMELTAQKLSARYGVPFFPVNADVDPERLERLCAAPNWIAVAQAAPEQSALLERTEAVMICMDSQWVRALQRLLRQPHRLPDVPPEQVAALKQACPHTVMVYGERAALRYLESAGLAQGADFV